MVASIATSLIDSMNGIISQPPSLAAIIDIRIEALSDFSVISLDFFSSSQGSTGGRSGSCGWT